MRAAKAIVKNRVLILIISLALMIPSVFGMLNTRINYDMLNYLPDDMDTVIGQDTLKEDFGKGPSPLSLWRTCPPRTWPP